MSTANFGDYFASCAKNKFIQRSSIISKERKLNFSCAFNGKEKTGFVQYNKSLTGYVPSRIWDCHKVEHVTLSIMQRSDKTLESQMSTLLSGYRQGWNFVENLRGQVGS